jgi:hypothetical protein
MHILNDTDDTKKKVAVAISASSSPIINRSCNILKKFYALHKFQMKEKSNKQFIFQRA